jgi:NAD(P) transhydrogenase subunit alpha
VQVSAAPVAAAKAPPEPKAPKPPPDPRRKYVAMALAAVVFGAIAVNSPAVFLGHFTVFALAVIVGFYVISNVAHALHTPLMAETNAISGIILVGGVLQLGSSNALIQVLAFAATLVASINIFGGFAVTGRMLQMFRKD